MIKGIPDGTYQLINYDIVDRIQNYMIDLEKLIDIGHRCQNIEPNIHILIGTFTRKTFKAENFTFEDIESVLINREFLIPLKKHKYFSGLLLKGFNDLIVLYGIIKEKKNILCCC